MDNFLIALATVGGMIGIAFLIFGSSFTAIAVFVFACLLAILALSCQIDRINRR